LALDLAGIGAPLWWAAGLALDGLLIRAWGSGGHLIAHTRLAPHRRRPPPRCRGNRWKADDAARPKRRLHARSHQRSFRLRREAWLARCGAVRVLLPRFLRRSDLAGRAGVPTAGDTLDDEDRLAVARPGMRSSRHRRVGSLAAAKLCTALAQAQSPGAGADRRRCPLSG
jgi:hypothetical protein